MGNIPILSPSFPSAQLLSILLITVTISSWRREIENNTFEQSTFARYTFSILQIKYFEHFFLLTFVHLKQMETFSVFFFSSDEEILWLCNIRVWLTPLLISYAKIYQFNFLERYNQNIKLCMLCYDLYWVVGNEVWNITVFFVLF